MTQTADVVVIGGGVNGVSIAYALAGRGVRVVLVEKGALAGGASGRSSALVRMHYTNEWDARLAWASFPVFQNWPELMGGPPVFTHTGFVNVGAAAYEPESGYADPAETVEGFRRRATLLGARILPWTAVTRIDRGESRVRGVETSAGRIEAGSVVVAAALPGDGAGPPRAAQGHRHGGGEPTRRAARPPHGLHRQCAGQLLPAGDGRPHPGWGAVPGVGHRSGHARHRAAARGGRPRRLAAHASHPGHGARHPGPRLSRLRRLQPGPSRHPGWSRRDRRALPGDRLQRLRLQDRACRRRVHGRAHHGWPGQDRRHRALRARALRGRPGRRDTVSVCGAARPRRSGRGRPRVMDGAADGRPPGVEFHTFTVVGRCRRTGRLGVGTATRSLAVGV